jgi:glycosidase
MAETMRDRLALLYPGQADEVERRLRAVLDGYRAKHPPAGPRSPFCSERDAVLICYADHVQEPGEKTLRTMRRFLDRYVKGSIPAVHFLPFYPYSSDDGFSVIDYYRIKDEFGDWDDISAIAEDFDLMFDLVINHVSAGSAWFQRFLAGDPKYENYFIAFEQPVDVSSVFRPRTHPLLTLFPTARGERYVWTTFSADQIDVNFSNPDVLLEYVKILLFYVEHGARIIRLDAIAYLWKELGTSSIHLPQTHEVVKLLRQILEEVAPNVWIITETNVPHRENISYFGNGEDEAHLVYNFALPPLLIYSLMKGDATELTRWAETLELPSAKTTFFNFTASHDGVGVTALRAMVSEEEAACVVEWVKEHGGRVGYRTVPGKEPVPYELNVVYLNAAGGVEPFIASQAIALSLQGVPAVYFNSLIGAENWEEGVETLGYNRAINRQKFEYGALSRDLDEPATTKHRVYAAYHHLLSVRRSEPLFSPLADQQVLEIERRVFAVLRTGESGKLLALANVSGETVELDRTRIGAALGSERWRDLLAEGSDTREDHVSLAPYGVSWLRSE